jgi:hypothetical protein
MKTTYIMCITLALAGALLGQEKPVGVPDPIGSKQTASYPAITSGTLVWADTPKSPAYTLPKILLITRSYSGSTVCLTVYPERCSTVGWTYNYRTFDSEKELQDHMNDYYKSGVYGEIVGAFRLDSGNKITVTSKRVQKVVPEHVEERKWEETEWSVR